MSETLTGRTTRTVAFIDKSRNVVTSAVRKAAGTTVYVTEHPRTAGLFIIRIPGTLLEQDVNLSAVEPE
jgi:hypothetical protein